MICKIKDVSRLRRLRRKKFLRGKLSYMLDRFTGWFLVTAIGFLTAVVAFLIVRSERWLFDLKEGHCKSGWWKSQNVCCASVATDIRTLSEGACSQWQYWDELFTNGGHNTGWFGSPQWAMEYISYLVVAASFLTVLPKNSLNP
jgi:chloride channel 3/4/5